MKQVLTASSPLLLGILFLMIGNGLQGTLLGVRAELEGFSTTEVSFVMSGYFLGFLGGSRIAPDLIRRVGHVRVFAALASFISAALILFPVIANPWVWMALRVVIGFCFSGVYVTAESWLNNAASNETRGKTLSAYLLVQLAGLVIAQAILSRGDPSGFVLFVIPSVLVSISFAPILLSITPTPPFETSKPMTFRRLYEASPLGIVGMFLMGGVFSAQMSMAAVYATQADFDLAKISAFVAAIFIGGAVFQLPVGYFSDRIDRRVVILFVAAMGATACFAGFALAPGYRVALLIGFIAGGAANPLYSLLIAHTNDHLETDEMASASGAMMFVNGLGSVTGPLLAGWFMSRVGPPGYFLFQGLLMASVTLYAVWRTTRRASIAVEDTSHYVAVMPSTSPVGSEVAQEVAIEMAEAEAEADAATEAETDRTAAQ
ncbi:MFS transporter [Celeribacter arenosi]|uniref:MFS transporter n=1 Tax=Celeribacter arenosi TaxID=792649 RepID=A0ABP7KBY0_9RHOB